MRALLKIMFATFVLWNPAHADHIYVPKKVARPSPRVCLRDKDGACESRSVALNELSGEWRGNLMVTDNPVYRRFAESNGLCKQDRCMDLSPYLSFGLAMHDGNARFTVKAFNQGSAGTALVGRNSVHLTPSKDGFMILRQLGPNEEQTVQFRMQIEDGATQTLVVKIVVDGNVIAHGSIGGLVPMPKPGKPTELADSSDSN